MFHNGDNALTAIATMPYDVLFEQNVVLEVETKPPRAAAFAADFVMGRVS